MNANLVLLKDQINQKTHGSCNHSGLKNLGFVDGGHSERFHLIADVFFFSVTVFKCTFKRCAENKLWQCKKTVLLYKIILIGKEQVINS